jgi:hypothetical protein
MSQFYPTIKANLIPVIVFVIGTDKTEKQTSESNFCEKRLFGPENL